MSTFGLDKIGQIHINVKDVDRATAFYKDRLGMPHLFQVPGMSCFDCGGIMLMLGIPTSPEYDHPSSILYFQVDDILGAYQTLVARGVGFSQNPHFIANLGEQDIWMAFFMDSEGNEMAIRSLLPKGYSPT